MISPNDEDTLSDLPRVDAPQLQVVDFGSATSVGLVRPQNEDYSDHRPDLFVVADGMGGAEGGALASRLTVQHFLAAAPNDGWIAALRGINERVRAECTEAGFGSAGSTVVGLVVEPHRCVTLAMGDSRIYRFRDGQLQQLTVDHNLGNLRKEEGLDPTLGDDRGKPRALTSYVGNPHQSQRIDVGTVSAQPGDRMLLTTDGVHEQLSVEELQICLRSPSCRAAAQAMVTGADNAGGRDNATAMVIEFGGQFEVAGAETSSAS